MDKTDSTKRSRSKVKKLGLVLAIILIGAFCLETYAHLYIHVDNISVVNSQQALKVPNAINGTTTFSYGGTKWLILMALPSFGFQPDLGRATFYIFKIEDNKNLLVQEVNLVAQEVTLKSNPSGVEDLGPSEIYPATENYSAAGLSYFISAGSYNVDFVLDFKIYETTPLGIFQVDQSSLDFNQTFTLAVY
jgi:hypothetical protein